MMNGNPRTAREILKKVRQVEIRSSRHVTEALSGAYHSVFKGKGMEFEEVREYVPGDDVRSIDWNVTAKMDRPFVKVFTEERELTIMLVADLSASGDFGSGEQSKRERAAELASVLAFSATRNQDKVGLLLFTDAVEQFIYPQKGRQNVLRVIREILFYQPRGKGTDLPVALNCLNRLLRRRAVVFLISDFLTPETFAWAENGGRREDSLRQALLLTSRRHDLVCVDLSDPRELELPDVGWITLEDAETGELLEVDTANPRLRRYYAGANRKRRDALMRAFRQSGIDHFSVSTDQPYIHSLRQFLLKRGRRR